MYPEKTHNLRKRLVTIIQSGTIPKKPVKTGHPFYFRKKGTEMITNGKLTERLILIKNPPIH